MPCFCRTELAVRALGTGASGDGVLYESVSVVLAQMKRVISVHKDCPYRDVNLEAVNGFPLNPSEIVVWTSSVDGVKFFYYASCENITRRPGGRAAVQVVAKTAKYSRFTHHYSLLPREKNMLYFDYWGFSQTFQYTLRQWFSAIRIQQAWRRAISDPAYMRCQKRLAHEWSSLDLGQVP